MGGILRVLDHAVQTVFPHIYLWYFVNFLGFQLVYNGAKYVIEALKW